MIFRISQKTLVLHQIAPNSKDILKTCIFIRHGLAHHAALPFRKYMPFYAYMKKNGIGTGLNRDGVRVSVYYFQKVFQCRMLTKISILIYSVSNHCHFHVGSFHFHYTNQFMKILYSARVLTKILKRLHICYGSIMYIQVQMCIVFKFVQNIQFIIQQELHTYCTYSYSMEKIEGKFLSKSAYFRHLFP